MFPIMDFMRLVAGSLQDADSVALLPGSFHPPTLAHLALAKAAAKFARRVVLTLPASFPHKTYSGVPRALRLEILARLCAEHSFLSVAETKGGLFLEMARELRTLLPNASRIFIVCGRDAAERIITWPYPADDSIERQLDAYELLVAARGGEFVPPPALASRIHALPFEPSTISATAARDAIRQGLPWRHMVPPPIHRLVEAAYSGSELGDADGI